MDPKQKKITVHFLPHVQREPEVVTGPNIGYGIVSDAGEYPTYKVWIGSLTNLYPASVIFKIETDI